jgi:hypothetical protein
MSQGLLVAALIAALLVLAWLYAYKLRHPYTRRDLEKARLDSVARSRSGVSGKVQEHLAPLFPEFISQFNPKDARFLGTPPDFVVFDRLDGGEVRKVVFVEVKTGKASLASRERRCRDATRSLQPRREPHDGEPKPRPDDEHGQVAGGVGPVEEGSAAEKVFLPLRAAGSDRSGRLARAAAPARTRCPTTGCRSTP